ncbi:Hsp70 family protein [Runella sp. CRIBMP]|uniref:Hsp70 family protein n=1 Tax=Runella sp. CRIBMP TaxID=2683261 RepID=UPI0014125685|nr:Hsp70 family protein [Runella sp. CRIBMP]NBB21857.1 Hsp70 family protein [Runella sp. CRIBMP]
MSDISCGVDFGTSNSTIAYYRGDRLRLVPVEKHHTTIPSALFFERISNAPHYGREAVDLFLEREKGRFMRSLKRVLGTSVMKQGTMVNGAPMHFNKIIGQFIKHLKDKAETDAQQEIESVVMGRPVHFIDNDPVGNQNAQEELRVIAQNIGFKNIDFQFEPIAAAFAHEVNVVGEQLALVVDIGGGTSDFTVIRLSQKYLNKLDRSGDILANTGVRIGGNDFDKDLSLHAFMPELGYRSTYGDKNLPVPLKFYYDLSEWSKINSLYTPKNLMLLRQYLGQSHDKTRFSRLLNVFTQESGHILLGVVEDTKIALTSDEVHEAPLDFIENGFTVTTAKSVFEEAITQEITNVANAATQCVQDAGVSPENIDLIILTGGSTEIPAVQLKFRELFPNATVSEENKLDSVGVGLAYDSKRKFLGESTSVR